MYNASETCKILGITSFTLTNWYAWERKLIKSGRISEPYLPQPIRITNKKGKPRMWDSAMVEQLRAYQKTIVVGRNGKFGEFSNPSHKNTKKYKEKENKDA
jgi:hypothetical protein